MTKVFSLRLSDALKAEAQAYAEAVGVPLNALCALALRDYLDSRKAKAVEPPVKVAQRSSSPASRPSRKASPSPATAVRPLFPKVGRNEPCPCGSGKKYKQCHGRPGRA